MVGIDGQNKQLVVCVKYALGVEGGGGVVFEGQEPHVGMLPELFVKLCEMLTPVTLSSVALPWENIGYEAARVLHILIETQPLPAELPILLPPVRVVPRESTDWLIRIDPVVASAVRMIRGNLRSPMSISEIARSLNVSRRSLEMRFRKFLRQSPYKVALDERIAQAGDLLRNTVQKNFAIAEQCGFGSEVAFEQAFLRRIGQTPMQYRKQSQRR